MRPAGGYHGLNPFSSTTFSVGLGRARCTRPRSRRPAAPSSVRRGGRPLLEVFPYSGGGALLQRPPHEHPRQVATELGAGVEVGARLGALVGHRGRVGGRRAARRRPPRPPPRAAAPTPCSPGRCRWCRSAPPPRRRWPSPGRAGCSFWNDQPAPAALGTRISVSSSVGDSAVSRKPVKKSSTGMVRSPSGPCATIVARMASSTAGRSDAGSPWAIEPPMVPRWRTCGSPTWPAACCEQRRLGAEQVARSRGRGGG